MSTMPRRRFLQTAASLPMLSLIGRTSTASPVASETPLAPNSGDAINAFAFDLYSQLASNQENQFVSPYSISTALAMTAAGAKFQTYEQMAKVLHLPAETSSSDGIYKALAAAVSGKGKPYSLSVANAIFAQTGYPWAESFKTRVTETFKAGLVDADFKTNAEQERLNINTWVEKQTNDKIKELLKPGILSNLTRMVLTNAIYFKGDWAAAFKKENTKDQPFTAMNGTKNDVPLMYKTGGDYSESDAAQMVRLPYKGNDLSFLAILPRKAEDFAKVEKSLSKETMATWSRGLYKSNNLQLWLPRFKLEKMYSMSEQLNAMGMSDAFNDTKANFDGMVSSPPAKLFISAVIHKAFVDVNEEGTEAAAATAVVMAKPTSIEVPQTPPTFRADRPFLFAIRHEASGAILFLGRVAKL